MATKLSAAEALELLAHTIAWLSSRCDQGVLREAMRYAADNENYWAAMEPCLVASRQASLDMYQRILRKKGEPSQ